MVNRGKKVGKRGQYAPPGQPYPQTRYQPPQPGAFGAPPSQPAVTISPKTLLLIGAVALFIILTFTTIIIIKANAPHCPATLSKQPCDVSVICNKETNYQVQSTGQIPGCVPEVELAKLACTGKVGPLVKFYDVGAEECVTDADSKTKIVPFSSTERVTNPAGKFRVTTEMSQPFNLNANEVSIDFVAEQLTGSNVKITHVELDGTAPNKQLIILGEQVMSKSIAAIQSPAKIRLRLNVPGEDPSGSATTIKLLIDLEYGQGTGTSVTQKTDRLSITLRGLTFGWLRPSRAYPCPETAKCDDGDTSTRDYCDANDAPFCKHDAIAGACGNGICEASENKCTCAADCGTCQGTGKVTSSQCVNNMCSVTLRPEVVVQPIKTSTQSRVGKVALTTSLEYNAPFNAKQDKLKVIITADQVDSTVKSFTIDKVQLLKGSIELSSQTLGQTIGVGGTATAELPLTTVLADEDLTPQVKVFYTLKGTTTDQGSYPVTMQKVTVYNPG